MPSTKWRDQVNDALRAWLWPVPLIGVLLAIGAGVGLPALDEVVDDALPQLHSLFGSTMDDARELLGTISTALITVTSLTFSLTVVTLRLAGSTRRGCCARSPVTASCRERWHCSWLRSPMQ